VVDVVPAVPVGVALPGAPASFLSEPSAGALRSEHLGCAVSQSQVANLDLVLDSHEGSVGQRDRPCDQRNKLLGSQRAAGRTGGNQISPALRLNLMETHRGPARMPGLVIERGRLPTTLRARIPASEGCGMALAQRIYALTDDELDALRRLHAQSPAPGRDDPVWGYLLSWGSCGSIPPRGLRHTALRARAGATRRTKYGLRSAGSQEGRTTFAL
jgi:hypothetical protein